MTEEVVVEYGRLCYLLDLIGSGNLEAMDLKIFEALKALSGLTVPMAMLVLRSLTPAARESVYFGIMAEEPYLHTNPQRMQDMVTVTFLVDF